MGTNSRAWTLDNERPAHLVDVPPFFIDTHPVTNGAFAEFVADGGYERPHWWSADGWRWRQEAMLAAPAFWAGDGRGWTVHRLGMVEDVDPSQPVQHVCWYEADAYARWRGARLPTEAEWEKAASWSPDGHKRVWPWGDEPPGPEHANLGQRRWGPAPIGTHPAGASAWGVHEMIGDVWEWTASDFHGYPGFESFPYREYSEVFFGPEYKVLRGGSWATDPVAMRCTFRNWDYPIRRQIFAGFRCARTA
jgi:iron(II)-dependent oxidoreductase